MRQRKRRNPVREESLWYRDLRPSGCLGLLPVLGLPIGFSFAVLMLDIGFSILASNFATRDVLADCSIDTGTTRVVLTLQDLQKTRFEQTKPYAGPWPSGTGMAGPRRSTTS